MMPRSALALMAQLVLLMPVPVLAYANIRKEDVEPLADNIIAYVLLVILFGTSAITLSVLYRVHGIRLPLGKDVVVYAVVGATGSALLLLAADWSEDYFSQPGITGVWSAVGAVAGSSFGTVFRVLHHLLGIERR